MRFRISRSAPPSTRRSISACRSSARRLALCLGAAAQLALAGAGAASLPRPDHVVVVIDENKAFGQIIGNPQAPYINALAKQGALFTRAYAITHPSQPNYLALFSGSTHGVTSDACLGRLRGPNLASELLAAGYRFATYSESLPRAGYAGCAHGLYRRKHNPAVNWQGVNVPASANLPFARFPADYARLPSVSIVIPNLLDDMHNGAPAAAIARGDRWLRERLGGYVRWARAHRSLFVLTWDEDDRRSGNHIVTLIAGAGVRPGAYTTRVDHYRVLSTLAALYGLRAPGEAARVAPITQIWRRPVAPRPPR